MYTECPTCNTLFRVRPAQLDAAGGKVRCGECLAVFDAREYLREDLEEPAEPTPVAEASSDAPHASDEEQAALPLEASRPAFEPEPEPSAIEPEPALPPRPAPIRMAPDEHELPFAVAPARPRSGRGWGMLSGALLVVLLGQYLWFHRAALLEVPALRPAAEALCGIADCPRASIPDPSAFELTGRGVQTHPAYEGALLIDATFVNRSETSRAYPGLELVFTDPEGAPLASRRFGPEEYLGQAPQQPLAPGAEGHVVLELLDPGDLAVGYEFRFF